MDRYEERFEAAYAKASFTANRFILDHMSRITRELEMDLESAFLWGVLANLSVIHLMAPGSAFPGSTSPDIELRWVRLSDVTQVTRLPKETARRKLIELQRMGKVQRDAKGRWAPTRTSADSKTSAFTSETVRRFLIAAKDLESILLHASV